MARGLKGATKVHQDVWEVTFPKLKRTPDLVVFWSGWFTKKGVGRIGMEVELGRRVLRCYSFWA